MNLMRGIVLACGVALAGIACAGGPEAASVAPSAASASNSPLASAPTFDGDKRPLILPSVPQGWGGLGVCYGPLRDGQVPNGPSGPTPAQLREDLHIMARHWAMIRMYASQGAAADVCKIIHDDKLPLKVLVGAWIAQESKPGPDGKATDYNEANAKLNQAEVAGAIKLANEYPDVVIALGIGNEAMVSWSPYRVPPSVIIGYIRQARAATKVPVTTCDTDLFWSTPESVDVAKECDFLALHAYAMWGGQQISNSLSFTREKIAATQKMHPHMRIVMTELGWATSKGTQGEQAKLIKAQPNEQDQELFYRSLRDWAIQARQPYFWFEAFDEKWKGGSEPGEVEKHWGVYNSDRTPKLVMQGREPDAK